MKSVRQIRNLSLCILAVSLLATQASWGATYEIDPVHSVVGFTIRHLVGRVSGTFDKFEGTITFDAKALTKLVAKASIDTSSVNTRNDRRDTDLRSANFFDVAKYPKMTFVSKKVTSAGKDKFHITGDLTLHGVTKPVTLEASYGGTIKDPWGKMRTGFSATTTINRKDFGIQWNKLLDNGGAMLGDDVQINLDIEAVEKK